MFQAKTVLTPLKKKAESEFLNTHIHRWFKCPLSWCVLSCRVVIVGASEGDQCWNINTFLSQLTPRLLLLLLLFFYLKSIPNACIYRKIYND